MAKLVAIVPATLDRTIESVEGGLSGENQQKLAMLPVTMPAQGPVLIVEALINHSELRTPTSQPEYLVLRKNSRYVGGKHHRNIRAVRERERLEYVTQVVHICVVHGSKNRCTLKLPFNQDTDSCRGGAIRVHANRTRDVFCR